MPLQWDLAAPCAGVTPCLLSSGLPNKNLPRTYQNSSTTIWSKFYKVPGTSITYFCTGYLSSLWNTGNTYVDLSACLPLCVLVCHHVVCPLQAFQRGLAVWIGKADEKTIRTPNLVPCRAVAVAYGASTIIRRQSSQRSSRLAAEVQL